MKTDDGKSLSLEQMKQVAKALEYQTAKSFPNVVGGLPEVAVIETDGKVEVLELPFDTNHEILPYPAILSRFIRPGGSGSGSGTSYGMLVEGPGAAFVEEGDFSGVNQSLDHIFFFSDNFQPLCPALQRNPKFHL